jgi:hypothetical protein
LLKPSYVSDGLFNRNGPFLGPVTKGCVVLF